MEEIASIRISRMKNGDRTVIKLMFKKGNYMGGFIRPI